MVYVQNSCFTNCGKMLNFANFENEQPIFKGVSLAHLIRLTGELIGYPWIRRPSSSSSVVRPSVHIFKHLLKPLGQSNPNFYVEPPWEGGTKVYINGPGHMTKMAATPIYGKNPSKIFFSRTSGPIFTKLGM